MKHLNVLIACEESQAECMAFRELGHNAYSCDLQRCRRGGHPEWHIHGNVIPFLQGTTQFYTQDGRHHHLSRWHLIIAHPPCTYLCKAGSLHLYKEPNFELEWNGEKRLVNYPRWIKMREARQFFFLCLNADCALVAVENPLPMAISELPPPSCFVCPSWYGEKYTKKTLYWLKGLPPLMGAAINPDATSFVYSSRGKYRSRTFAGVAKAIALQWGNFAIAYYNINKKEESWQK